jgi:hypothetical protein
MIQNKILQLFVSLLIVVLLFYVCRRFWWWLLWQRRDSPRTGPHTRQHGEDSADPAPCVSHVWLKGVRTKRFSTKITKAHNWTQSGTFNKPRTLQWIFLRSPLDIIFQTSRKSEWKFRVSKLYYNPRIAYLQSTRNIRHWKTKDTTFYKTF